MADAERGAAAQLGEAERLRRITAIAQDVRADTEDVRRRRALEYAVQWLQSAEKGTPEDDP